MAAVKTLLAAILLFLARQAHADEHGCKGSETYDYSLNRCFDWNAHCQDHQC